MSGEMPHARVFPLLLRAYTGLRTSQASPSGQGTTSGRPPRTNPIKGDCHAESRHIASICTTVRPKPVVAPPFDQLAARWVAEDSPRLRATTQLCYIRSLKVDVLPRILDFPVDQINRAHLEGLLEEIKQENGPGIARNAKAVLSCIFNWAIAKRHMNSPNPKLPRPGRKDRWLRDEEIKAIWEPRDKLGDFGRILRLLILTGCRANEIARMRWDELDLKARQLQTPRRMGYPTASI